MSRSNVDVCDKCGKEITTESMKKLPWDSRIQPVTISGMGHVGIQKQLRYDLCKECGLLFFLKVEKYIKGATNEKTGINA